MRDSTTHSPPQPRTHHTHHAHHRSTPQPRTTNMTSHTQHAPVKYTITQLPHATQDVNAMRHNTQHHLPYKNTISPTTRHSHSMYHHAYHCAPRASLYPCGIHLIHSSSSFLHFFPLLSLIFFPLLSSPLLYSLLSSALETPMAHEQQQADEPPSNSNGVEENVVSVDVLENDDPGTFLF